MNDFLNSLKRDDLGDTLWEAKDMNKNNRMIVHKIIVKKFMKHFDILTLTIKDHEPWSEFTINSLNKPLVVLEVTESFSILFKINGVSITLESFSNPIILESIFNCIDSLVPWR